MGLPLDIDTFLLDHKVSVERFTAVEPSAEMMARIDNMLTRVGHLGNEVDSLYADILAEGLGYDRLVQSARSEIANGGPANLDALIAELLEREQTWASALTPKIKKAKRFLASVQHDEAFRAVGLIPILKKEIDAMALAMEQIRDARWQMMVVKAEVGKRDILPATSDPAILRRHLRGLAD